MKGGINGRDPAEYDPYDKDQASGLWSPGLYVTLDNGALREMTDAEHEQVRRAFAKKGAAQRKDQDDRAREAERAFHESKRP